MADPVTVQFALTRAEYTTAARSGTDRLIRVGAVGGAGILAVGVGMRLASLTTVGAMVVLAALVVWILPWWRWLGEPSLAAEERWVVDDEGCAIERTGSQCRNDWSFYREVADVGPVYALFTIRGGLDVVPKRALTPEAAAAFIALASAHVGVRGTSTPSTGWTD